VGDVETSPADLRIAGDGESGPDAQNADRGRDEEDLDESPETDSQDK
jgi:hypothetical protein